ncbi:hypothetical protein DFH11DRAFT_1506311 [Phellopilus nigrolimitatus]|nr:hypothetical protein DFH11DRAFT_1506311 [Phellopilus nigrolimitatus]
MDNAGNCNTTATETAALVPSFRGMKSRLRCFAHILNLIAKIIVQAVLSLFSKPPRSRKAIKIGTGTGQPCNGTQPSTSEFVIDHGDHLTVEEEELAEVICDDEVGEDNGQDTHDTYIVSNIRDRAMANMAKRGVTVSSHEEKTAQAVLPKVAGLAKKVHDSGTLKEKFDNLVEANREFTGHKRALDRRVSTRWNSEFACIEAHFFFRTVIEQLTGTAANKLQSFRLNDRQWIIAQHLCDVLAIFDGPTKLFSKADVPLIADTIPMLTSVHNALKRVCAAEDVPAIVRIAAHAGELICEKYSALADDCEVYRIAIVMSPDKKLAWFIKQGFSFDEVQKIQNLVIARWEESYKCFQTQHIPAAPSVSATSSRNSVSPLCYYLIMLYRRYDRHGDDDELLAVSRVDNCCSESCSRSQHHSSRPQVYNNTLTTR